MDTSAVDYDKLNSDGDTVELPDGRELRLSVEPDDVNPFEEYDAYGRLEWQRYGTYGPVRPDGFTGTAEIVERDGNSALWWQPPVDGPVRGSEHWSAFRQLVSDLMSYGFHSLAVELLDTERDAYGRRIVRGIASVSGVEPFQTREYQAELIAQLVAELAEEDA